MAAPYAQHRRLPCASRADRESCSAQAPAFDDISPGDISMNGQTSLIPVEQIEQVILLIRG
jgi:hypothetical protein